MVAARITGTIVHVGDGTVVHAGDGTMRYVVKAAAVKPTRVNYAAVEPATTVESSTTVASPPATRVGEVWLAERSNAQHGSCGPSQSRSYPGPGSIFA